MSERRAGRRTVGTSSEDKVLLPGESGEAVTKGALMDYYQAVAGVMLPHLKDRPLTMQRFPDGLKGEGFYQKQVSDYFPDWIGTVKIRKESGETQSQVVCNNEATLVYLANQAVITPHVWLSRTDRLDQPDQLVFDLDPPGAGRDFEPVRRAAFWVREALEELGFTPFAKTTGSRGVHVVAALDRSADFDESRAFGRDVARLLAARHPKELTTEVRKNKRRGRIFLDVGRNAYAQTAVAPYAVRARPDGPVATPVTWRELGQKRTHPQFWNVSNLPRRLGQRDDPWADMFRKRRSVRVARRKLEPLLEEESHGEKR